MSRHRNWFFWILPSAISLDTVDRYRTAISAWQYSMSDKADVLLYGCNLAASEDGQRLLNELRVLTDTDVAASEDLTGAVAQGGDWDLEYQVGSIETATAAGMITQADWMGVLDITTGLTGLWTLDADPSDSSGNGYNGTLTNGAAIDTTVGEHGWGWQAVARRCQRLCQPLCPPRQFYWSDTGNDFGLDQDLSGQWGDLCHK